MNIYELQLNGPQLQPLSLISLISETNQSASPPPSSCSVAPRLHPSFRMNHPATPLKAEHASPVLCISTPTCGSDPLSRWKENMGASRRSETPSRRATRATETELSRGERQGRTPETDLLPKGESQTTWFSARVTELPDPKQICMGFQGPGKASWEPLVERIGWRGLGGNCPAKRGRQKNPGGVGDLLEVSYRAIEFYRSSELSPGKNVCDSIEVKGKLGFRTWENAPRPGHRLCAGSPSFQVLPRLARDKLEIIDIDGCRSDVLPSAELQCCQKLSELRFFVEHPRPVWTWSWHRCFVVV